MRDVSAKDEVERRAVATGALVVGAQLGQHDVPDTGKGDLATLARVVGLLWAKQLPALLPDAHPVRLTAGNVSVRRGEGRFTVTAECTGIDRTGVEMEALAMCLGALTALWDALKPFLKDEDGQYPEAAIQDVRVTHKGKAGSHHPPAGERTAAAVVVATDTRRQSGDESGPALARCLEEAGCRVTGLARVPDAVAEIGQAIEDGMAAGARLVVATGGTGASARDVTPQALAALGGIPLPGFGEAFRARSWARTGAHAALSRCDCALVERNGRRTVVACIPGHPEAVATLAPLVPALRHAAALWGDGDG